jgi:hypothetical protein
MSLIDLALKQAEKLHPGGQHRIDLVELDGEPGEPAIATVRVSTIQPLTAVKTSCKIT